MDRDRRRRFVSKFGKAPFEVTEGCNESTYGYGLLPSGTSPTGVCKRCSTRPGPIDLKEEVEELIKYLKEPKPLRERIGRRGIEWCYELDRFRRKGGNSNGELAGPGASGAAPICGCEICLMNRVDKDKVEEKVKALVQFIKTPSDLRDNSPSAGFCLIRGPNCEFAASGKRRRADDVSQLKVGKGDGPWTSRMAVKEAKKGPD